MRMALICVAALAATACWSSADATTLSGFSEANGGLLYISTDDSTLGTPFGISDWPVSESLSTVLTPGVTNYLHVLVLGGEGGSDTDQMFIADLSLSDSKFQFANGTQHLLTNTTDWKAGTANPILWTVPTFTPLSIGADGTAPWGNAANIDDAATYLNAGELSTAITPVPAVTPAPPALPLFASGLAGLGFLARWKRKASSV